MRKDIKEEVHYYIMKGIRPNYAEIGRRYGCDYRTAKKYYEEDAEKEDEVSRKKSGKPSKLDPYREIIKEKITMGCTAMSVYKFIEKKGYTGKYTIVKDFCREFRTEKTKKATIRVETNPGICAQVDWKENMVLHDRNGKSYKFNIFLYVLHYSKMKYITLTWDRKQDTLLWCMCEAFEYTGGVPKEIWFDNAKTIVDVARTQFQSVKFNDTFYGFSKDAGYKPIACRSFRPQTKGAVESLARLVERIRPYDYEFEDSDELVHLISDMCLEFNYEEISQATDMRPADLWSQKEKEYLQPFDLEKVSAYFESEVVRIVSQESMVNFRKCKYSVPVRYIGCEVELTIDDESQMLYIYYKGEEIKSHPLSEKRFNYKEDDYFDILKSDLMADKDDEYILDYIKGTLGEYDNL